MAWLVAVEDEQSRKLAAVNEMSVVEAPAEGPGYSPYTLPCRVIEGWCGGRPNGLHTVPGTAGPLRVEVGFVDGASLTLGLAK